MTVQQFKEWLAGRVAVLDGAMGTMIQRSGVGEDDFRGTLLESHPVALAGNNDMLSLTRPDIIGEIHRQYVEAGADIITTNTFNANSISQADYLTGHLVADMNRAAARLARSSADKATDRRVLVAGSVGPTNRTASMSPDVADPAARNVDFDMLVEAYSEQIAALIDGGVDLLLMETVFDTLNLKAALTAAAPTGFPVMVSVTIADRTGRTLTGQTLEAFVATVAPWQNIVSIGLNCSFGPETISPFVELMDELSPVAVSVHPNAGLPDENGCYNETPARFVAALTPLLRNARVNIIGGCCGTTPGHIASLADAVRAEAVSRPLPEPSAGGVLRLAGLERLEIKPGYAFVNVGERCNVAGSRKFLRLIKEGNYSEALDIARRQVEDGAMMIDINMDDAMLDAPAEMEHFLRCLAADPAVSRVPLMIDSSRADVIERALRQVAGRPVVNSISLKEGEEAFLDLARRIHDAGAAVVVMAFDEQGQADTAARKIEIARRSHRLLTSVVGFRPEEIIFDAGIMSIATGMEEHDNYAVDFIETVRWIKSNLPGMLTSGGVSNLSFALRGHNRLREAMHAVFLYHAIAAGLDMAIVNPATAVTYEELDGELRQLLTDVILNRRPGARDSLIELAAADIDKAGPAQDQEVESWRLAPLDERLKTSLVKGIGKWLADDIAEALEAGRRPVEIIEGPLMEGMNRVGTLFGEGKMFLPQVVKTARTMKAAVDILRPVMDRERRDTGTVSAGKVVLATVKGDVHDIGKNIVGIVLACNNYEVIDLGVMVSAEEIVSRVIEEKPLFVGLSGLITPSLGEMMKVARALERAGVDTPMLVGGATTSLLHTALKIAPERKGPVIHVTDASRNPVVAAMLANDSTRESFLSENEARQQKLRGEYSHPSGRQRLSLGSAREQATRVSTPAVAPAVPGVTGFDHLPIKEVAPYINWKMFLHAWRMTGEYLDRFPWDLCDGCIASWKAALPEGVREKALDALSLYRDARSLLGRLEAEDAPMISAAVGLFPARADGDDIVIDNRLRLPMLRSIGDDSSQSLADFVTADGNDWIGVFALTAGKTVAARVRHLEAAGDSYNAMLLATVADRLAEAASEWLHCHVRRRLWGYAADETLSVPRLLHGDFTGIRPAVGYPSLPDQTLAGDVISMLPDIGVEVTGNGALSPAASELGLYIASPQARYFNIISLTDEQIADYAARRGMTVGQVREVLLRLVD